MCGEELPFAEFYKGTDKYGLHYWCKRCIAKYNASPERKAARAEYRASPKGKAASAEYRASPKYKAARAEYRASPERKVANAKHKASPKGKASNAKHRASPKGKATMAKWLASPKGKAAHAKYLVSPKGKATRTSAKAKRRGAEGSHTAAEWRNILELYGEVCIFCGGNYEVKEHLIPISKGGRDDANNVVPACGRCNNFKRAKLPNDLPLHFQEAIKRHAELLGEADENKRV